MPALTMRDVFIEAQKGLQNHGKQVKNLKKIYDVTKLDEFWRDFLNHLKYSMIIFKREPGVERTIEFVAKFATSLVQKSDEKQEVKESLAESDEEEEEMHPFLMKFFSFLLESHNANDKGVRFRVCQLINKLLNSMGEEAQIDDDLYDRIYECMLQRLRDKFPIVRVQAVVALTRLQDPRDMDCPVINAYIFLLGCDTNPDVRRAVLSCIAASTKTLPVILERTRDTKDTVRKLAYCVISEKIHIKALTIAQRVRLLQEGLNDRIEIVKDSCSSRLLQAWLRTYEGNILEMMKCLDVENSLETSEQALKSMLTKSPVKELVANFDILNEELVIPVEEITPENVMYWRCLCEHIKARSDGKEDEELLDKILPTGTNFSKYMQMLVNLMKGEDSLDMKLRNEFILQQLLQLAASIDLADEVGRRNLQNLLKTMLTEEDVTHSLVKPLLHLFLLLHKQPESRINQLIEIISDIRMPITQTETSISKEEKRKVDLQVAGVRVELNQLREELEMCVQGQQFERAAEIKKKVEELDVTRQHLLEEALPRLQEARIEKNDPATLLKCLTIAAEMLQDISFKKLLPSLLTLSESLILPGIQNEDPAVRNLAVKALGLCCVVNKDVARTHLLLFMQVAQIDIEAVKVTALQVIFDLLLTFGMESFDVNTNIEEDDEDKDVDTSNTSHDTFHEISQAINESGASDNETPSEAENKQSNTKGILTVLTKLLDSETSEVRTVAAEGLAKLVLSGRVASPKLLSRLLLLWYNPVTEDDNYLRHCLGAFFPVYAFAGRLSQEIVEQAFMPTMKMLFNAPSTSPLAEVNQSNVAELLVQLTNVKHLLAHQGAHHIPDMESCPHDSIAISVCNEILSDPNSFDVRTLCKILNLLELCPTNNPTLSDVETLCERMHKEVKDKQCLKALEKFEKNVDDMLAATNKTSPDSNVPNEDNITEPYVVITKEQACNHAEAASSPEENKENVASRVVVPDTQVETNIQAEKTMTSLKTPESEIVEDLHVPDENKKPVKTKASKKGSNTIPECSASATPTRRSKRGQAAKALQPSESESQDDDVFASPAPSTSKRATRTHRGKASTAESTSDNSHPRSTSGRRSTRKR